MSAYVQEIERVFSYIFVDNRLDTPSDNQVLSDIFGSRRRYPTINSSAKSEETVKTTSYKENITCEGSSAVKWPPVVKSSPPIAKSGGHFFLIQFCLQQPIPLYKIICKERPMLTLPKAFGITELYRIAGHLYDPYLPSYSCGNYCAVKI